MDAETARAYLHPLERRLPEPREPPPPRSASKQNKLDLFKLLASTGRLGILEPEEVRSGICSGLCAVTKEMVKDVLVTRYEVR